MVEFIFSSCLKHPLPFLVYCLFICRYLYINYKHSLLDRKYPPTTSTVVMGPSKNPARAAWFTKPTKQMPETLSPSISPNAMMVMVRTRGRDQATIWKYALFLSIRSWILPATEIVYYGANYYKIKLKYAPQYGTLFLQDSYWITVNKSQNLTSTSIPKAFFINKPFIKHNSLVIYNYKICVLNTTVSTKNCL